MASLLKIFNSMTLRFQGRRPPFEGAYIYLLMLFIGYMMADLGMIYTRPLLLPEQAPPTKQIKTTRERQKQLSDYTTITSRNVFNEDGVIPPPKGAQEEQDEDLTDAPAVASSLPLKLQGTIVHYMGEKSVATIELTSKNETNAYRVGDEIGSMARVTLIEKRKVTFINLNSRRREFIDIPDDLAQTLSYVSPKPTNTGPVAKVSEYEFTVRKTDVEQYIQDLPNLVQKAATRPVRGADGRIVGWEFKRIEDNSAISALGFKVGDVLKSVNGEALDNPMKGMELFNRMRSETEFEVVVERNGREEVFRYNIN
ncbi:MAG: hypothetical protein KDD59_09345 [Bdellovibrionales bacterium]|nr:hypothetical protein [Bdellovibrionales bacterium]